MIMDPPSIDKQQVETSEKLIDRFNQVVISEVKLSQVTGLDRLTVAKSLAPVSFAKVGRGKYRRFLECLRACFEDRKGMNGAERWRAESADKVRVEREILERKWRPVTEIQEAFATVGAAFTRVVEESNLTADEQERLSEAMMEAMGRFEG